MTKNHRDDSEDLRDGGVILFQDNEFGLNPGLYMERFLAKLHPDCEFFLQRPQRKSKNFDLLNNPDCWFEKNKVGPNMVGEMMPLLSEAALVPRLTNGQVRPTSVSSMKRGGADDREICTITGHKNSDSLKHYNPHLTEERQIEIAQTIANKGRKRHASAPVSMGTRVLEASQVFEGRKRHTSDHIQSTRPQQELPRQEQVQLNPSQDRCTQEMVISQTMVSTNEDFETEKVSPMGALQMMILNEQRIAINHEKAISMTHAAGVNRRTRIIEAYQKSISKD